MTIKKIKKMKKLIVVLILGISLVGKAQSTDDLNLAEMIQPIGEENILYEPGFYNWGSSIVKGNDGKYHLFYAQMTEKLGFYTWLTDGLISRAISDKPEGPYKHVEVVLKGRGKGHWDANTAHNPRIKYFNGKYYLYYMSTNTGGQELNEDEWHQARTMWIDNKYRALVRENQRIGVAIADQIEGPWKRLDQPIVEPSGPIAKITCNPAITQRPDGGFLMLIRGDKPNEEKLLRNQAIGLAPSPEGPWTVQKKAAVDNLNAEDPAVWYDHKRQRYYAIYHAFGYMGLITSEDGLNWKNAKHHRIIEKSIVRKDGTEIDASRLERPFVYVEDGEPKVMTVAIREGSGKTYYIFILLKEKR